MNDSLPDTRAARYAILASAIVLAAVLLAFASALLQSDGLIYPAEGLFSDLTITHWPAFDYLRTSFQNDLAFPLWRTSILSGTPFAADPVAGVWYPPNWLSIVLPLESFFKLILVAHLFFGGWSMLRLARSFGVGWIGATASGIAYAIAPRAVAHAGAGHITLVEAWAWLPLAVYAARCSEARPWRSAVEAGLALGLCTLADARVAVYAAIVLIAYVLASHARLNLKRLASCALRLLAIGVAAMWTSAAIWLPALAVASESTRASLSLAEAGAFSLPPEYLLGTLLAGRGEVERLTYVGLAVLILASIGVRAAWRDRRRIALWLLALAILGALIALGVNASLYPLLYSLPGLSLLRVPGRAWLMVTFVAALACGFGVDALMRRMPSERLSRAWKTIGLCAGAFALLFGLGGALLANRQPGADRLVPSMIGLALFLPATLALIAARSSSRLSPMRFGAAMLALISIDLVWVAQARYRVVAREAIFADGRAAAEYLQSMIGEGRVYSPSYSLPQHVAQVFELELTDGIDPLQLARYVRFMQQATGVGAWSYSVTLPAFDGLKSDDQLRTLLSNVTPDPALLGVLNVKYVAAHFPIAHSDLVEVAHIGDTIIYQNRRVLPRAWVAGQVDTVADQAQAMDWLSSHDVSQTAVVEGGHTLHTDTNSEARIVERHADRIVVSARGPGLLVLSEVFERDWRASIDGEASAIYPTDAVLRGVYLPEGEHRVEFVYDPITLKLAVAISASTPALFLIGLWWARRRAR